MNTKDFVICTEGSSKSFDEIHALKSLDLRVPQRWFKSSRRWKHLVLWFSIINVMMVIMIIASSEAAKDGNDGPPILFMYGI